MTDRDKATAPPELETGRREAFLKTGRISAASQERLDEFRRKRLAEAEKLLVRYEAEESTASGFGPGNRVSALRTKIKVLKNQIASGRP